VRSLLLFLGFGGLAAVLFSGRKPEPISTPIYQTYIFSKAEYRDLCFASDPSMTRADFERLWASLQQPKSQYLN
jgi:hypothetical protein